MKIALMAIGIPGSGKTTLLKPLAERYGLAYINRDEIRQELFGESAIHKQSEKETVWDEADLRTIQALSRDQGVVLDSTFTEVAKRQRAITVLHESGASHIIGIIFNTPLEHAQERNRLREYVVDDAVLSVLHYELLSNPPTLSEGFDALYTIDQLAELEKGFGEA